MIISTHTSPAVHLPPTTLEPAPPSHPSHSVNHHTYLRSCSSMHALSVSSIPLRLALACRSGSEPLHPPTICVSYRLGWRHQSYVCPLRVQPSSMSLSPFSAISTYMFLYGTPPIHAIKPIQSYRTDATTDDTPKRLCHVCDGRPGSCTFSGSLLLSTDTGNCNEVKQNKPQLSLKFEANLNTYN